MGVNIITFSNSMTIVTPKRIDQRLKFNMHITMHNLALNLFSKSGPKRENVVTNLTNESTKYSK